MTCERHAKKREQMRRQRSNPEYREREKGAQHQFRTTDDYRAQQRERYTNLPGHAYNKMLLRHRRTKALARMAKRHVPKEKEA